MTGNDFNCTKCGSCCRLVPDEALEVFGLPRAERGGCGHLRADNSCAIYENRPSICDVRKTWSDVYSGRLTWEEYKVLSEAACLELQGMDK